MNKIEKSALASRLIDKLRNSLPNIRFKMRESKNWYRKKFEDLVHQETIRQTVITYTYKRSRVEIGSMYMFLYDPKWKEKLPYYDTFPLIFPIEMYSDGFLGLNLHYLPPGSRAALLDTLNDFRVGKDRRQRLALSYRLLKGSARYKPFEVCVKRYLSQHVRSNLLLVEPDDWETVIYLPTESFQKATLKDIWNI